MELPDGEKLEGHVAKLNRCIYELKQSPRAWYFRLINSLRPHGFEISDFDPCVLAHQSAKLYIAIYVDDITLFGENGELMDQTVDLLKREFKVSDLGLLHWVLGIQVNYSEKGISLSQTAFIEKVLARFSMQACNPVVTPMDPSQKLEKAKEGDARADARIYQQMIGSIMYLVIATRPDLAYATTHLSQYCSDPCVLHFLAVKRLLRYLKDTSNRTLLYRYDSPLVLSGFCDASHGNCLDTRRNFSGYLFQLGDNTISWRCKKHRCVATSSCEAEYIALSFSTKHHMWLCYGLHQLVDRNRPAALFSDSNSAIDLVNNPKLNEASKHIDIAYHFTREKIESGTLTLLHIPGTDDLADICTKALTRTVNDHLCTKIFGTK